MAYRLTRRAREDVVGIYVEGVGAFGVRQADAYLAALERAFQTLADHPRMARERAEIRPPVRVQPCGAHIVVYLIEPDGGILVVRVRHGREDWIDDPGGARDEPV